MTKVLTLFLNPFEHTAYCIHYCCNRSLFTCCLLISQQTAVISLYRINTWFTFLLQTLITVSRIETKFLRIYYVIIVLQRIKWLLSLKHERQIFCGASVQIGPRLRSLDHTHTHHTHMHTHTRTHTHAHTHHTRTHTYTHTTPMNQWSSRRCFRYLHERKRRTSTTSERFEPTVPPIGRLHTCALDGTAVVCRIRVCNRSLSLWNNHRFRYIFSCFIRRISTVRRVGSRFDTERLTTYISFSSRFRIWSSWMPPTLTVVPYSSIVGLFGILIYVAV